MKEFLFSSEKDLNWKSYYQVQTAIEEVPLEIIDAFNVNEIRTKTSISWFIGQIWPKSFFNQFYAVKSTNRQINFHPIQWRHYL